MRPHYFNVLRYTLKDTYHRHAYIKIEDQKYFMQNFQADSFYYQYLCKMLRL
jgi:hypothetical protein